MYIQEQSAYSAAGKYVDRSLGIYKSLTVTCMWKLRLSPRNSQKNNTYVNVILLAMWRGSPGLPKGCIYIDRRAEETWKAFQQNIMKQG